MHSLKVFRQGVLLSQIEIEKFPFYIGRAQTSHLILSGINISRTHLVINKSPHKVLNDEGHEIEHLIIEDKSTLGTVINGQVLHCQKKMANHEDVLFIDEYTLIYFYTQRQPKAPLQIIEASQDTQAVSEINTKVARVFSHHPMPVKTKPRLVVMDNQNQCREWIMSKNRFTLGTLTTNDIVINDPCVSKQHALLMMTENGLLLKDLGSTNGTILNGANIREAYIQDGQKFKLGGTEVMVGFFAENTLAKPEVLKQDFCDMVGQSPVMHDLYQKIEKVAATDLTAMIQGDSGTGKELVAKAIHNLSKRCGGPYVVFNCAAISKNLIESELFGHEKGAFTGADNQHKGLFEQAHDGTLFLDEIGELPLVLQSKILRVLEYRVIRRVGGDSETPVNVRLVCATHRSIVNMVSDGQFREDLHYRLSILPLYVPQLRERLSDLKLLAEHLLKKIDGESSIKLSACALAKLKLHTWPGNIRELRNTLMRAKTFSEQNVILAEHIHFMTKSHLDVSENPEWTLPETMVAQAQIIEHQRIKDALKKSHGDKSMAAQLLGISRATLFRKIKLYSLLQ